GAAQAQPRAADSGSSVGSLFSARVAAVREHFTALMNAFPQMPDEFARVRAKMAVEFEERGPIGILILFVGFAALGIGAQRIFYWAMTGVRQRMSEASLDTVGHRLRAVFMRFAFGLGVIGSAALGTIGAFLVFDWPPVLGEVRFGFVVAFLGQRLAIVLGRVL